MNKALLGRLDAWLRAGSWKVPALLLLQVLLLGGWLLWQVYRNNAGEVAVLRADWFNLLVLLIWMQALWLLIKLATRLHDGLRPDYRGWLRPVAAALPAALLTVLVLFCWEIIVVGYRVPGVLVPAPSAILVVLAASPGILWDDFVQTVVRSVLPGYLLGCGAGICVAACAWRFPAVGRGLLPLGNFMSVMPIVGVAPIMVLWFGFDWQSKAAVAALMTFFPMLVNAIAGFAAAGDLERDLMRTYAASRQVYFRKLVLPAALPFVFNGLKVCSTLALIGAIIAEFFGTPIVGMGFRISSEIGRMGLDKVWATIAVSAVVGTAIYGLLVAAERAATFWDASVRARR